MEQPLVKIQVHEHTATVTLNRPEKRNALSRELLKELHQALDDLHQERRVRGVIIAGAGKAFCAGMDLSEMLATTEQEDRQAQWHADSVVYHELIEAMLRFPKPLVAAVGGPAVAGGAGLVMACDLVVASDNASFGFPEPRRGIVAGMVAPLLAFRSRRCTCRLSATHRASDQRRARRIASACTMNWWTSTKSGPAPTSSWARLPRARPRRCR